MDNPITSIQTASKGITIPFIWKTFLSLLAIIIVFGVAYWIVWIRGLNWTNINALISQESATDSNPVNKEMILMQAIKEIVENPRLFLQAKTYASQSGIPLERVLVNNAISLSKEYQYIA